MNWHSKAALGRHMPCHNKRKSAFEQEESDSEIEDSEKCTDEDEVISVFGKIFEIFKSPFVELEKSAEKPMLLLTETYVLFFVSRKQMPPCQIFLYVVLFVFLLFYVTGVEQ